MVRRCPWQALVFVVLLSFSQTVDGQVAGNPGDFARYSWDSSASPRPSQITTFSMKWAEEDRDHQWLELTLNKANGDVFRAWFLTDGYPSQQRQTAQEQIQRYIIQTADEVPLEFRTSRGSTALPNLGYWLHQLPRASEAGERRFVFPQTVELLGHRFQLNHLGFQPGLIVPSPKILRLPDNFHVGSKHTRRDSLKQRYYDERAFELLPYQTDDYKHRLAAGQTTFNVPGEHVALVRDQPVYYTGDSLNNMPYPERLYQSNYQGPHPDYLDEPAVVTGFGLRRELLEHPDRARQITLSQALDRFYAAFDKSNNHNRTWSLHRALSSRPDLDLGTMELPSKNLWLWEVFLSSGAYQLQAKPEGTPTGIVYEGRSAASRDLPLFNSSFGSQIPTHDQQAWLDIVYGLLRGAARVTDKEWGISVYGHFKVPEVYRAFSYAYDLGASYFLFWTGARGHHVPYQEQLHFSKFISDYAKQHPQRDMARLKRLAEVIILFPEGYTLISKEPLWWAEPLHYEKENEFGLKHREILARVAAEIERCYRLGVAYDLAWELEGLNLSDYREIVRVRMDGTVFVETANESATYHLPRWPTRPQGDPPGLEIRVSHTKGSAPLFLIAEADVVEKSSPVYFSFQHDNNGVWTNTKVMWQLYGPGPHRFKQVSGLFDADNGILPLALDEPGEYRLRASVVDRTGRSTIRWQSITVE